MDTVQHGPQTRIGKTEQRFVGQVGPAWDWLGTPERREVVRDVGEQFDALGITRVVLTGAGGQLVGEFENGKVKGVMARQK